MRALSLVSRREEKLSLDRLRSELARLEPSRRLAMLAADPVHRGDLFALVSIIGNFSRRLSPDGKRPMALPLLNAASEIDEKEWN